MHSVVNDGVSPSVFSYMENNFNILCVDVRPVWTDSRKTNTFIMLLSVSMYKGKELREKSRVLSMWGCNI